MITRPPPPANFSLALYGWFPIRRPAPDVPPRDHRAAEGALRRTRESRVVLEEDQRKLLDLIEEQIEEVEASLRNVERKEVQR